MAQTFDSDLTVDILSDVVHTVAQDQLAALNGFSRDFSSDVGKSGQTIQVTKVTAGSDTLTNPTNFEAGDATVGKITVSLDHLSQPFHITNAERRNGHSLATLFEVNMRAFANGIMDVVGALLDSATFTNTVVVKTASNMDSDAVKTLAKSLPNYSPLQLVLDNGHYIELMPDTRDNFDLGARGAWGADSIVKNNRWDAAEATTAGFMAAPAAIGVASAIPEKTSNVAEVVNGTSIMIPDLGLTVEYNEWVSLASRAEWASFDVAFGAAVGEAAGLTLIQTV